MLLKLCAAREESTVVDENKALNDAKALYKAGEGKIGTDDEVFINIFGRCSFAHLKAVATQYAQTNKKHHTLDQAVDSEFSGAIFQSLRMVLLYATFGRIEFYADYVYRAMKVHSFSCFVISSVVRESALTTQSSVVCCCSSANRARWRS